MSLHRSNRSVYQTHYHIVFPVKYRKALLVPEIEKEILRITQEITERHEIEFEKVGTAIFGFKRFLWLRKELWGGEFWSDGYYASTVGKGGNPSLRQQLSRRYLLTCMAITHLPQGILTPSIPLKSAS